MEGSLQVEQTLLDELQALRARVSELEYITEVQRQKLIVEQHTRLEAEAALHCIQEDDRSLRQQLERRSHDTLEALLAMAEVLVKGVDHHAAGKDCPHLLLSQIVHRLAKLARRVLDCRRIGVTLVEAATGQLHPLTIVGVSSDERKRWQAMFAEMPLSNYINDAHLIKDLQAGKPLWLAINEKETAPRTAYLLLPMRIGTQLSGLLSLDYGERRDHLTDEEMAVAQAVSRLIGLVLERESLLQERAEAHANELALREANRRTDEFLSITSHELRTPLTTINGNIQLAKRRIRTLTKDEPQEEFYSKLDLVVELLSRAERQVRVQNRLVSDLLDVSRIQSNRLELHADAYDLATIVSECVEDQRASNPSRTLTLCSPGEAVLVLADSDRIGQVVTNYLTNALKYSTADMPVEVHLTVEPGLARVAVYDRGPGLPPEELQRLWQRFYRVAGIAVRSGSGVGLGLGLYICRSIIELHHGEVGVQSSPGQGSIFWFTLPLMESASEAEDMGRIL